MSQADILRRVREMAADQDSLPTLSPLELAGVLMKALEENYDELPDFTERALYMVAACLLRDHCDAVEEDILAVRSLMRPK